jgi:hypothetical protein
MGTTLAYDATHEFISFLPQGQAVGYCTGSLDVQWTVVDAISHPGWVQIDQSPDNTLLDERADVLDYENGAATIDDIASWAVAAYANWVKGSRPGQRQPLVYCSWDNRTAVCNALVAGGITSGVGLYVASWGIGQAAAEALINSASGPYPILGVQYDNGAFFDLDVFSTEWLNNVSKGSVMSAVEVTTLPPGWWEPPLAMLGKGADGNMYLVTLKTDGKTWSTPVKVA